jgi:MFS family permease
MYPQIKWAQYSAALISAFASFGFGATLSWSSPVSHQLQGENEYFTLNSVEFGWIASIVNIGCIISALVIGYAMDRLGRKKTMLLLVFPVIIGWILIIWAQNFPMMLIGRLLCGFAGAYCMIGPQYTSEIAEKEIRGIMGAFKHLLLVTGILFSYIIGPFTNVFWFSMICATFPLVFAALFLFMPESPYFLIANGRKNEAIIALKWLRGSSYNILKEIDELSAEIKKHKSERGSLKEELFKKSTIRGIFIAYGLMFFSGMAIVNKR